MRIAEMKIDIPEDVLYALNQNKTEFIETMKLLTAVQLYKEHRLSLGKAALLAGIHTSDFLMKLASFGVAAIDYDSEGFTEELSLLGSL